MDFRAVRVPDTGQDARIRRILNQLADNPDLDLTDYPTAEIDAPLREAAVNWIGPDKVGRFTADDVVLTLGAQNGLLLALQTILHGPSPVILTEDLAYQGCHHAARLLRAQIIGVEMDEDGLRPDKLEEALRRHGGQVLVTSVEVHSPTTTRTTFERRKHIARIAQKYQLHIIDDDCHCITRHDRPSYRAICPERAWFVTALTKSVSAALRCGFMVAPTGQAALARQTMQSSYYGIPQPALALSTELLRSGEAEAIRAATQAAVEARVKAAVNVLGQWDIRWRPDAPFLWLKLPRGWRGSSFDRACADQGIRIKPGDEFALADGQAPHAVRITLNSSVSGTQAEAALQTMSHLLSRPPINIDV